MDKELKRNLILEHYQNPINKGLVDDPTYQIIKVNNEGCLDKLTLMVKKENDIIKDIRFDGEACVISASATSLMIKTLLGKRVAEVLVILREYEKMINEGQYDEYLIGDNIVYNEIYKQPNRKRCALLPWVGIKKAIKKEPTK